jgi:uncharacterized protein (TIGR00255 family)
MTGFGRGEAAADGFRLVVEVRTVNHRFFTATVRLPREYAALEARITARLRESVERGHATASFELAADPRLETSVAVNRDTVRAYLAALAEVRELAGADGAVDLTQLLTLPGVLERRAREPLAEEAFAGLAAPALDDALRDLVALRDAEGERLREDLVTRVEAAESAVGRIERLAPEREVRERERLAAKVRDLLGAVDELGEARLAQEAALLADRLDISEEITRFRSHLELFRETLAAAGPSGRQLGFVLQEMLRETNTMGSKANDARIAQEVIGIKNELEKLREQVENVE